MEADRREECVAMDEDDEEEEEEKSRRLGVGYRVAAGCLGKETGRGWNFARARLHPPRLPPPPLDAEGSWTARVRCQFCARSPPLKVFNLLVTRSNVLYAKWTRVTSYTPAANLLKYFLFFRLLLFQIRPFLLVPMRFDDDLVKRTSQ